MADLPDQVQGAIELEVPERLIPARFRAAARRSGVIQFRHIRRTLTREPAAEQLNLVLAALAQHGDVILFVESLEIQPTQADMLHRVAEHVQIAAAVEDGNRRTRPRGRCVRVRTASGVGLPLAMLAERGADLFRYRRVTHPDKLGGNVIRQDQLDSDVLDLGSTDRLQRPLAYGCRGYFTARSL